MMRFFFYILYIFFTTKNVFPQSSFSKLSRPEKCWAISHLIKAKKAQTITKQVQLVVDSVKRSNSIGTDNNGGKLDAFKHAYWMASLAIEIGRNQALKLGNAHEKGNYLQFKKRLLEDTFLPDSVSSVMDLKNNEFGVSVVAKCQNLSSTTIQKKIMDGFANGKLSTIKKDEEGNFLTCEGGIISLKEWTGKWGIPKCIEPSLNH